MRHRDAPVTSITPLPRTRKKSILIAAGGWFYEGFGGAEKAAADLAEHLVTEGHRVFVVAGSLESSITNPIYHRGVELWRYPVPRAADSCAIDS